MVMDGPSPQSVGREFVRQYYTLLNQAPHFLHRFYSQESLFVHGGLDNEKECQPLHGQQEIHQRIMQLKFVDCKAKIRHVDAHATLANGVVVQVSGELSNNGQPMRRFMQTFVLAPQSPKKYYVHNDIFRYQDEVFSDDEIEEDHDEVAAENEKNRMASSPESTTGPPPSQPMKVVPGGTLGSDGIATVSINASVAQLPPSQQPKPDVKKDLPHLNGGHGPQGAVEGPPTTVHHAGPPAEMRPPAPVSATSGTAVAAQFRPQPDVTSMQPMPTTQPQPVAFQQETESGDDSPQTPDEKDDEDEGHVSEEEEESEKQPPEPAEARNQGQPTYANLVKSGPTIVPNQGSLPPAGFSKPVPGPVTSGGQSGVSQAGSAGYGGHGQQSGSGKYKSGRPSVGGSGGRGGSTSENPERYGKEGRSSEDRRRTMGGGSSGYPDSHQLFVGNLPHNCTEEDLERLFGKHGKVAEVRISTKGVSQSKGSSGQRVPNFGFVVFEDEKAVFKCLDSKPIHLEDGHRLNVETKKNKIGSGRSGEGQSGGSLSSAGGQTRGSQDQLGNAGRGSDRARGGSRGGQRGGRTEGGGGGGASRGGGQRGGQQGGESRGGQGGRGGAFSRRS